MKDRALHIIFVRRESRTYDMDFSSQDYKSLHQQTRDHSSFWNNQNLLFISLFKKIYLSSYFYAISLRFFCLSYFFLENNIMTICPTYKFHYN